MDRRRFVVAVSAAAAALIPYSSMARQNEQDFCTYRGSMLAVINMMTWFFDESTRLTSTDDPTLYTDEAWRIEVLSTFAVPRSAQAYLIDVVPPAEFQESHDLMQDAIDASVTSGEFFTTGLLTMDPGSIQLAAEYLGDSTDLINQASAALPS